MACFSLFLPSQLILGFSHQTWTQSIIKINEFDNCQWCIHQLMKGFLLEWRLQTQITLSIIQICVLWIDGIFKFIVVSDDPQPFDNNSTYIRVCVSLIRFLRLESRCYKCSAFSISWLKPRRFFWLQPSHMNYAVASDYRFVTWTTTIPQGLSCNIDALLSIHWEWCGGVIELRTNTWVRKPHVRPIADRVYFCSTNRRPRRHFVNPSALQCSPDSESVC